MVRQFHLRTQGGHESSASHPDIIGDRCVSIQIKTNKKKQKKNLDVGLLFARLQMSRPVSGVMSRVRLHSGGRAGRVRLRVGHLRRPLFCKAMPSQLDTCHERQISS